MLLLAFASLVAPFFAGGDDLLVPALVESHTDPDYRLTVKRLPGTLVLPAARPEVAGADLLVSIEAVRARVGVRAFEAPGGADGLVTDFIAEALERFGGDRNFEFRVLDETRVEGGGRTAIRLFDETAEDGMVLECRVIERDGIGLRLVGTGPLSVVGEDGAGLAPLFGAFQVAEGAFNHRTQAPSAADHEGPGYRVRGGVLESGALGVRVPPPVGWRTASRADAMDWSFRAHVMFERPADRSKMTIEVAPTVPPPGAPEATPYGLGGTFAGRKLEWAELQPMGRPGELLVLEAHVEGSGRGVGRRRIQLVVPRASAADRCEEALEALGRAELLTPEAAAEILGATTGARDPQAKVDHGAFLRNGSFASTELGLAWAPPSGVWTHLVRPDLNLGFSKGTVLSSYDDALGWLVEISHRRSLSKDLDRAHRRGLRTAFSVGRADAKAAPAQGTTWLGQPALVTRGEGLLGAGALVLVTTLMDGQSVHLAASSFGPLPEGTELSALDELIAAAAPSAPASTKGRFTDEAYRFSIDLAGGPWERKVETEEDRRSAPMTRVSLTHEDGTVLNVTARWAGKYVENGTPKDNPVHAHLARSRSSALWGAQAATMATVPWAGRELAATRLEDEDFKWWMTSFARGSILYTVTGWNTETPGEPPALESLMARLTLLPD